MFDRIHPSLWMMLPREQRDYIATAFNLPHTGVTEIKDQTVVTDGYTIEDLANITSERMAEFVGSEAEFPRLWELTIAKTRSELHPPIGIVTSHEADLSVTEAKHARKKASK